MKTFAKITAFALIGAMAAIGSAGCNATDDDDEKNGYTYTLRFRVDNDTNLDSDMPKTIIKVEFINGDRQSDKVLYQITQPLAPNDRSTEYRVSGFTVEDENDLARRKCGVRVTFEDNTTLIDHDAFGHGNKVLVSVYYSPYYGNYDIDFSDGKW
jgi:hypothetical protein